WLPDFSGYDRLGERGGDWGASFQSVLGASHPDRLVVIHFNLLAIRRDLTATKPPTPEEQAYLVEIKNWMSEETGYQWIQGTKPQTLAYGLTDSPVGLAPWIVEKFRTWSSCRGD